MLSAAHNPPHSFALLDELECEDWVLRVLWHKRHWRLRHPQVPFYSLGLASYLDCNAERAYWDEAQRAANNRLLFEQFGDLLELLRSALQANWQQPVRLADAAAWPGFHIYLPHPAFAEPVARIHRDLQYRNVFPNARLQGQHLRSFTLPLSNPLGSGLQWWPEESNEDEGHEEQIAEFFPYQVGHLVQHGGLLAHQAILQCHAKWERITLQGHAAYLNGAWQLYW